MSHSPDHRHAFDCAVRQITVATAKPKIRPRPMQDLWRRLQHLGTWKGLGVRPARAGIFVRAPSVKWNPKTNR